MNTDYELIHRLTLEELADVISDKDLVYLKKTIREDPEAFNVWFETRNILNEPDVKEFLERSRPVEMIFQATLKNKRRPGSWKFYLLSLAATIVVVICICYFYYSPVQRLPVTNNFTNINNVRLDLPGKEPVDLSNDQKEIKLNGLTVNHSNNAITFATTNSSPDLATLTVPQGKDYKITLNDGSTVWLNSTSSVIFPLSFPKDKREITVSGEAFIEVAKSTKPFFVKMPGIILQVLGTSFNINTYDSNKVQVALLNGAVKVQNKTQELVLYPGQQVTRDINGMNISNFDTTTLISWRQGLYIFNNKPLSEVMQVIPRWFKKRVVIDNPDKGNSRFTGVIYKNEPVEHSLEILKATNNFDYYIQEDVVHIK